MAVSQQAREFSIGALVRARGREWVVVPGDDDGVVNLRPLGGTDDDVVGIIKGLERVESADFPLPTVDDVRDATSAAILRDAIRLNVRAGAGPFRSFGRIAVEPRDYQLVPLLMALRQNPVRLLIADDVGIGKTIEAGMIARELLDRREINRIAVVCPPHLCEQWAAEMQSKFSLPAVVVRPGTVSKLSRSLPADRSIFQEYPFTVVSIDYVKSQNHRSLFLKDCPEFVIVDEAHTSASAGRAGSVQHQRHQLLRDLVSPATKAGRERHLVMTTATPHSGIEDAFRSLLTLLDPAFEDLPDDERLDANHPLRLRLADHFVQRRRADIEAQFGATAQFPERKVREELWAMTREYGVFFDRVLAYARELVGRSSGMAQHRQRVSWWAALAMLRCAISSPAAAAATLTTRAAGWSVDEVDTVSTSEQMAIDEQGERLVMDSDVDELGEVSDVTPGADVSAVTGDTRDQQRIRELIKLADGVRGDADSKLTSLVPVLRQLLDDGFRPIVFCKYVATAEYLKEELAARLKGVAIDAVTGSLPPEERFDRVETLAGAERHLLVATDCLAEGINLQEHFDAVVHYDLAWNPTRHEQREGRVDRFGQARPEVRTVMYFGNDNPVDRSVMDVLLRKAERIRKRLGVAVSVPQQSGAIMDSVFAAIFQGEGRAMQLGLGISGERDAVQMRLGTGGVTTKELHRREEALDAAWKSIEDREQVSRTRFQQRRFSPTDVQRELAENTRALGSHEDIERFVTAIASRLDAPLRQREGRTIFPVSAMPPRVRDQFPVGNDAVAVTFTYPVSDRTLHLSRTSDAVEALCGVAIDGALDPHLEGPASRAGVIATDRVSVVTTVVVTRLRVHLHTYSMGEARQLLAEESLIVGWRYDDRGDGLVPLEPDEIETLLRIEHVTRETPIAVRRDWIRDVLAEEVDWRPLIEAKARERADEVLRAHRRVRDAALLSGASHLRAEPFTPVDVIGLYVYLPA